ncbi:MAG: hypothetical protein ACFFF4_15140 [Candidatus Thorarchaeota archaeon]
MASNKLRSLLENLRDQQVKVRIIMIHQYPEVGYIVDVQDDYLTMKSMKNSEEVDNILLYNAIASINTKFVFK